MGFEYTSPSQKYNRPQPDCENVQPASKKRTRGKEQDAEDTLTDGDYEMVERGIAEASKERPSTKVIRRLMRTTFPRRRKWIVEASPSVPSVLESYPALKTTKYLWRELITIVGEQCEETARCNWIELMPKVVALALKEGESAKALSTMLSDHKTEKESYMAEQEAELNEMHCLELLHELLRTRRNKKNNLILRLPGDRNVQDHVATIQQNWPYIGLVPQDATYEIFLIAERQILAQPKSCWDRVKSLFGAYFSFDIEYPLPSRAFLIFFQFFVMGLNDSQQVPSLAARVKCALDKV